MVQRDQRDEAFYRRLTGFNQPCLHNECSRNRDDDPFCLCHLDENSPVAENRSVIDKPHRALKTPVGLQNLGNTCYMNSYLQALFHALPVRRILYEWSRPTVDRQLPNQRYDIVEELQRLFAGLQSSRDRSVNPKDLVKTINVNVMRQQDAQEFSILFLEWVDVVLADRPGEEKLRSLSKGRYRSVVRCDSCQAESSSDTDFYDFGLQINEVRDVEASMRLLFADEKIDDYACERCQKRETATKRMHIIELPRYLNLHLLRYIFDRQSSTRKKLTHSVAFSSTLDMRPFLSEEQVDAWGVDGCTYELTAILVHVGGGAYGGHYFARLRVHDGRWFTFNDEHVDPFTPTEGNEIDAENAYMLVYERKKDVEFVSKVPDIPQHVDLNREDALAVDGRMQELRKTWGGTNCADRLLGSLKVRPGSMFIWLPTEWLKEICDKLRNGKFRYFIAPDMLPNLCCHRLLGNVGGLKAVDAEYGVNLLSDLAVMPTPFVLTGGMFCSQCCSTLGADSKKGG